MVEYPVQGGWWPQHHGLTSAIRAKGDVVLQERSYQQPQQSEIVLTAAVSALTEGGYVSGTCFS